MFKALTSQVVGFGIGLVSILSLLFFIPLSAQAATQNLTPTARVSFTFDDGLASAYQNAAPILQKYGFKATEYIPTGCVGTVGTCPENDSATYMTWPQVLALQNSYGWDVGSHTVDTPCLANDCAGVPTVTPAQIVAELVNSKQALQANGITAPNAFAPPYGDYNPPALAQIAKVYTSNRGFQDVGYNVYPYNDYLLYDQQVQGGVSVSKVESYINTAIKNKSWLVLSFHDILPNASTNPDDYQYSTKNLDTIASYVKSKGVQVTTVSGGLLESDTNLLPNGSFNDGIADGWTTDAQANITADNGGNGSFPDPTNSIKLTSTTKNVHLFSPKVAVTPGKTYAFKDFLNVSTLSSGEVAFYIDEYDKNGNWISGQYRVAERSVWVEDLNFTYTPTSANVSQASLQVIVTGNPGITAYLDNVQMFPTN